MGDFDRHSDVDFIVAIKEALSDVQVAALQVLHERVYPRESGWAWRLEDSYFPQRVLRSCAQRGGRLWYLSCGRLTATPSSCAGRCASTGSRWAGLIDRAWDGHPNPALSVRQPADLADSRSTLEFVEYVIGASRKHATGL